MQQQQYLFTFNITYIHTHIYIYTYIQIVASGVSDNGKNDNNDTSYTMNTNNILSLLYYHSKVYSTFIITYVHIYAYLDT